MLQMHGNKTESVVLTHRRQCPKINKINKIYITNYLYSYNMASGEFFDELMENMMTAEKIFLVEPKDAKHLGAGRRGQIWDLWAEEGIAQRL